MLEPPRKSSRETVDYSAGLSDDEMDRKGSMPVFGGGVSVEQVAESDVLVSAPTHLNITTAAVCGQAHRSVPFPIQIHPKEERA